MLNSRTVTTWRINAACSCFDCRCVRTKPLLPASSTPLCDPEDRILQGCSVPYNLSLKFPMNLPGSEALSLFSTSKKTRKKKRRRRLENEKARKSGMIDAAWESNMNRGKEVDKVQRISMGVGRMYMRYILYKEEKTNAESKRLLAQHLKCNSHICKTNK